MYVIDAGSGLLGCKEHIVGNRVPILLACDGIDGDCAYIFCRNEVVERRGRRLLVERILLDGLSHRIEILLEYGLSRTLNGPVVSLRCDRCQDHDDRQDDH